ncbi:hypothetical protein H8E50_09795, partial [bacterium]|nr:hypothetical protein [bacterium]
KFNAGQKINALAVLILIAGTSISGLSIILLKGHILTHIIHIGFAATLLMLLLGHLYLALINKETRHSLKAVITGYVNAEWLREHHGKMTCEK